ncbi:YbaB/EbfC family nucleoid-associated protein [Candidatus Saccharibacteria bacterium]|nr:YbaB/EbfC family nucleoid-associated protein [Candidatus Saccharibacteria bacterium]
MSMMDKAKMAQKALKLQKELKRLSIETEAGDGLVHVTAGIAISSSSMNVEIRDIKIDESATEDLDRLQDLLASAINKANKEIMAEATEKMQAIAGGLGLPGM